MTGHRDGLTRRSILPVLGLGLVAAAGEGHAQQMIAPLADGAPGTVLQPGVHRVMANTTLHGDLMLLPGARIEIARGRTLAVLGQFAAPLSQVFIGEGRVNLNGSRTPAAYPEWWGAVAGDGNADCLPALTACLAAHPSMLLGPGDYYIADTWTIERGFCRIWGSGYRGTENGRGTRILVKSGSADVIRVGFARPPGSINDFLQAVDLRWMSLARAMPVDAAGSRLPVGLNAQYLVCCQFEGVSAFEHGVGFRASGVVRSYFRDCMAFRSLPGRQGSAPFRGFLLDGMADIGLAGGNASIFLVDCNASMGGQPRVADPVGLLLDGGFADSYIINFETAGIANGIRARGRSAELGRRAMTGHGNLHIRMPIIDQCSGIGIEVSDTSEHGLIELAEPYIAVARGSPAAIRLDRMRGALSISGGQLYGRTDAEGGGAAVGLHASDSRGLAISGLKVLEHREPIRLERCSGLSLQSWIGNPTQATQQAAVNVAACRHGSIAVQVSGKDGAFPQGVAVTGEAEWLRIDVSGIDAAALAGGAAARAVLQQQPLRVPGRMGGVVVDGA
ncbi:hypothetical protein [Novosphingobium sp.]|uniref:hypothetical protein n=1 Tax=Novosphingobium sp. TaxID=1874826 RepID=UPI00352A7AD8